jgi:hypothetical protein
VWPAVISFLLRSWESFRNSLGTTSLGFIAPLVVSVVSVVATLYFILREQGMAAMKISWKQDAWVALRVIVVVTVLVYGPIFLYQGIVRTIYNDRQLAVQLAQQNTELSAKLEKKRHSLDTTDPVFPNTIYLLQAFSIYRHALGGAPCQIKVTAPPESQAMANMVAQFSNSVSSCNTFGPLETRTNPDVEKETMDGMVPDLIVFHAARNDRAADQLFNGLGNQIQLKRSYEIPAGSPKHFVWLQFGTRTKWNSELR